MSTDDYFRVVAEYLQAELRSLSADQQRLADSIAPAAAAAEPGLVRRLQEFDLLRQRLGVLERLAAALGGAGGAMGGAEIDALLSEIDLAAMRDGLAQRLGRPAAGDGGGAGGDVELF